jgi:hypothetical protein
MLRNTVEAKMVEGIGQGRKYIMTSLKYFLGDKIKENKTGWACGTYGGRRKMHTEF